MPIYRIPSAWWFPDPRDAELDGLLGVGGDLKTPGRLLTAYRQGIFPWYAEGQPILWWSPDPRMVLHTDAVRVPRSLAKRMARGDFQLTLDRAFADVIGHCAALPREGQEGTWLTRDMVTAYVRLHELGHAHSVEAWSDGSLVGGLYGVAVGRLFCGESMFFAAPDASKAAFVTLVEQLRRWSFPLIDAQVHTDHLERFGATRMPRDAFLDAVAELADAEGRVGPWQLDDDLAHAWDPRRPR